MVDTIKLSIATANEALGPFWEPHGRLDRYGLAERYVFNTDHFRATHRRAYNRPLLVVEASLPKLVNGGNEVLIEFDQLSGGIASLLDKVQEICPNLVLPRKRFWRVSQVDFCHQWQVASPALYIRQVSDMQNKRKGQKKQTWSGLNSNYESLEIGSPSGSYKIRLYDKGAETTFRSRRDKTITKARIENAQGLLRFEVACKYQMLNRLIGEERNLGFFCRNADTLSTKVLGEKWSAISAGWDSENLTINQMFRQAFQCLDSSALKTYGLILAYGADEYRALCKPSQAKWYRDLGSIREHHLPMSSIGHSGLPILTLPSKSEIAENFSLQ